MEPDLRGGPRDFSLDFSSTLRPRLGTVLSFGANRASPVTLHEGRDDLRPGCAVKEDLFRSRVPATRIANLLRYAHAIERAGGPVDSLLARAGIPSWLLATPSAAVPLENALRFGELACRALDTEHLGLHVGITTSFADLGAYGSVLQRARTLAEYLNTGIALFGAITAGQRLWLSSDGHDIRFSVSTAGRAGVGAYQSELEVLAFTIRQCRQAIGPHWSPREVGLAYRSREDFPEVDLFVGSRILRGTGQTYFTIPRESLGRRFEVADERVSARGAGPGSQPALPDTLGGMVSLQVESLLSDRTVLVDTVAESLGMSRRTLQRQLSDEGLTFSEVLAQTRVNRAAAWLENSDKPIVDIALDLGYRDASNFTRAFRRVAGVPPQAFRDAARRCAGGNSAPTRDLPSPCSSVAA